MVVNVPPLSVKYASLGQLNWCLRALTLNQGTGRVVRLAGRPSMGHQVTIMSCKSSMCADSCLMCADELMHHHRRCQSYIPRIAQSSCRVAALQEELLAEVCYFVLQCCFEIEVS